MIYFTDTLDFRVQEKTVLTLGKFDGIHRGHELLMEELLQKKKQGLSAAVFTFDVPPRAGTKGEKPAVLTTNEEKKELFKRQGVDYLIECPFTEKVRLMEPEAFIRWIREALNVRCIVAGKDFCFGHDRAGDHRTLKELAPKLGYEAVILDKVRENDREISSTYVREEIGRGAIAHANALLGYAFFVRGRVIHGDAIGRTIGVPTINICPPPEKLLPPNGVYVTRVTIGDLRIRGVTNVGCKPTVSGEHPMGIETHLIDFSGDLYDRMATVEFYEYLRPEKKFSGIESLKRQMQEDICTARRWEKN